MSGVPVQQVRGKLEHDNLILGSELFSSRLVGYTLFRDGTLELQQAPPDGLTITYRYYAWPYDIVACDVAPSD